MLLWGLVAFVAIASFFSVVELFLAHTGVNYEAKESFVNRHLYRLSGLFYKDGQTSSQAGMVQSSTQSYTILKSWSLQALYKEKNGGFAIVLIAGKTHFVNVGENLQGYLLEKLDDKVAYFTRAGKRYKLTLNMVASALQSVDTQSDEVLDKAQLRLGIVTRKEVNKRVSNPRLIWSEIKISPYRSGGVMRGYVIRDVKKGSIFEHLGLKRSDLIVSANGEALDSDEKVIHLYKNIDKINALVLGVERDDKVEELSFEIK